MQTHLWVWGIFDNEQQQRQQQQHETTTAVRASWLDFLFVVVCVCMCAGMPGLPFIFKCDALAQNF